MWWAGVESQLKINLMYTYNYMYINCTWHDHRNFTCAIFCSRAVQSSGYFRARMCNTSQMCKKTARLERVWVFGWFERVRNISNRHLWDTFIRNRAEDSLWDLKWTNFLTKSKKIFKNKHVVLLNRTQLLLNKRRKILASSDFQSGLPPRDLVRQGQTEDHHGAKERRYLTDAADLWWRGWNEREEPNSHQCVGEHGRVT
jgi:hypothetical protein